MRILKNTLTKRNRNTDMLDTTQVLLNGTTMGNSTHGKGETMDLPTGKGTAQ